MLAMGLRSPYFLERRSCSTSRSSTAATTPSPLVVFPKRHAPSWGSATLPRLASTPRHDTTKANATAVTSSAALEDILALQAHQNAKLKKRLEECLGPALGVSSAKGDTQDTSSSSSLDEATAELLNKINDKLQVRLHVTDSGITWWDITAHPTAALEEYRDSIAAALVDLGAHETLVEATLETVLLPQTTIVEGCQCLVVRCAVEDTSSDMDSIQELTNRLTILVFRKEKRVVTVHRTHMASIGQLMKRWREEQQADGVASSMESLVLHFVKETCRSYHRALAKSIVEFDNYEAKLFAAERRSSFARQIYHIKRRASVYSRILVLTQDAFSHLITGMGIPSQNIYVQDVVQDMSHVRSLSDELNDNANAVLQLLFQLSSYQLNELMRVLTMFSAFFIPLSFIASVYGMNFDNLPGLNDPNGHMYCLGIMGAVGISIVVWFKVKKFW
jgi:magnesium transporter